MRVPVNKVRQHNSFIAGARCFRGEFLGALRGMIPTSAYLELEKISDNLLKAPKYKKIGGDVQTKHRKLAQHRKKK